MGIKLILKDADFSVNGFDGGGIQYQLLLNITSEEFNNSPNVVNPGTASTPYLFADKKEVFAGIIGRSIAGIRMKIHTEGVIPVYTATFNTDTSAAANIAFAESFTASSSDVGTIKDFMFTNPVILSTNQKIFFGNKDSLTMTGRWYYGGNTGDPVLCLSTNKNRGWLVSTLPLTVDYLLLPA